MYGGRREERGVSQKISVLRTNIVHDNRFGSSAVRSGGGKICFFIIFIFYFYFFVYLNE